MIYLIRHGETEGNATRVVQHPETPLSERGIAQARTLAERLAGLGVDRILTSDYARASMTAACAHERTGAPVSVREELRERNYGDLRGRPYDEIGDYILMEGYEPPGGESWEVFHERVDRAWQAVHSQLGQGPGNLAVFTHGLVCYSLASRHLRMPSGVEAPMSFGNTSLTVIDPEPPWAVQLLACCEHLEGTAAEAGRQPSGI